MKYVAEFYSTQQRKLQSPFFSKPDSALCAEGKFLPPNVPKNILHFACQVTQEETKRKISNHIHYQRHYVQGWLDP